MNDKSIASLQEENMQLKNENMQLNAKTNYYECIIKRLINNEELSTGQVNTIEKIKEGKNE